MRDFCKISPQFWTGKTGKSLRGDAEAQIVALYLMTSPHSNMIGVFTLPVMYLSHETGLSMEGASMALQRVCEAGFCTFEADSELVWVHEMARYQIGDHLDAKDKRCKGVQNELAKVASPQLRKAFCAKYKDDFHLQPEAKKSKPLPSPFQATSKQGEGEREGEGEGEHPLTPDGGDVWFESFWSAYPKKVGKDAARKAFDKRKPDGDLVNSMTKAIEVQAKSQKWTKDAGQFIPNPATWINSGGWKDETSPDAQSDLKRGSDEYAKLHKTAGWWYDAGFDNVWNAMSAGCYHDTASRFADGKKLQAVAS